MPQAFLGIAFNFGIVIAFAAVTGEVPGTAWLLWTANMFMVLAYDTEYAMVDRDDDLKIGMKTSAITLGRFDVAGIMLFFVLCWALTAAAIAPGDSAGLSGWAWASRPHRWRGTTPSSASARARGALSRSAKPIGWAWRSLPA